MMNKAFLYHIKSLCCVFFPLRKQLEGRSLVTLMPRPRVAIRRKRSELRTAAAPDVLGPPRRYIHGPFWLGNGIRVGAGRY